MENMSTSVDVTKIINEGLRNAIACSMVSVAGAAIVHYPRLSIFGPSSALWVGLLLAICGSVLLLWNVIYSMRQLRPSMGWDKLSYWSLDLLAAVVLLIVYGAVFGVSAQLNIHGIKTIMQSSKAASCAGTAP